MQRNQEVKGLASALWGFAEATLFFILPDVLLSYLAMNKKQSIVKYSVMALLGALIGGTVMYWLGVYYQSTAWQIVESVPAIDVELMDKVGAWMMQDGLAAIFLGPSQGLPYKAFAVQAYGSGIGFWWFMLISVPARLVRFLVIAYLARLISIMLFRGLTRKTKIMIWLLSWFTIYSFYFAFFPS